LLSQNPQITFTIGNDVSFDEQMVEITLPYAAFDLEVSAPIVNSTTKYFPLKRAANDSQYTLGRTFLQEAYLTADYERGNFSVSPCIWDANAQADIVTIHSKNRTTVPTTSPSSSPGGPHSGSHLSIALGVTIGVLAFLCLLTALIWFLVRKRKTMPEEPAVGVPELGAEHKMPFEKPADEQRLEADSKHYYPHFEADSGALYELPASEPAAFEMHTPRRLSLNQEAEAP
jgi:hypothetical protein